MKTSIIYIIQYILFDVLPKSCSLQSLILKLMAVEVILFWYFMYL